MAKKSKPIWDKPRPKGLGKPKKLTPAQKAKAKAILSSLNKKPNAQRWTSTSVRPSSC